MNEEYAKTIKFAMGMEMDGHNFFKEKASMFANATTRGLFEKLAQVELGHYEYLKKELDRYVEDASSYVVDTEFMEQEGTENIFKEREKSEHLDTTLTQSDVPDMTILRMAYLIERDFAEFYEEAAEDIEDERLKELFKKLAEWEYTHESIFKTEYKRLKKEYMTLPWGG
ncbi:MAG: ferritin family protein [Tissierellia bacterium]|nr:ferritin family protein [Tissierellia bacterium]